MALTAASAVCTAAFAGPDVCGIAGTIATCSGNQVSGVSFIDISVITVNLSNLTQTLAPPSGTSALDFENAANAGLDSQGLIVSTDATLNAVATNASGIFLKTSGGTGLGGSGGSFLHENGGGGTDGMSGGGILVNAAGAISVTGDGANAIDAEAVGGEGGGGGGAFGLGSGGNGGAGGTSGNVGITNNATLSTDGANAHDIFALALGGEGNIGGTGGGGNGTAGAGGDAGQVSIFNYGTDSTQGDSASAIFGRSLGGSGSSGTTGGSDGASGGAADTVTIYTDGAVSTTGDTAHGVFADSIGGFGGNGVYESGVVVSGGNGGSGGAAGDVTVTEISSIATSGDTAYGIFARSLGGGGGGGANAGGVIANSGTGGAGGDAGTVTVSIDATGTINTQGDDASAVYGLSSGGAGGPGGNVGGLFATAAGGGDGGIANAVSITNDGFLSTSGVFANGIEAESTGGQAGGGGMAGGGLVFGGDSGAGSEAGAVTVENDGVIQTSGIGGYAILADSIGGSGGDAGSAGGILAFGGDGSSAAQGLCVTTPAFCNDGGTVDVTNKGTIATSNTGGLGIFAESIGGGGGNGGASNSFISIGGSGGAGGNGGEVDVTNSGSITTLGDAATDIYAQSVGGGGGYAGDSTAIALSFTLAIGGNGGSGGNGGLVDIDNTGTLQAQGNYASVIFAQSVGGGGGDGGDASATGVTAFAEAVGGDGGNGGFGYNTLVTNTGQIESVGDHSDGIFAQSVGGGGGNGGSAYTFGISPVVNVGVSVGGQGGGGGSGGIVEVNNSGLIETWGDNSVGVFAQSVGGGGGTGGGAASDAISLSPTQAVAFAFSIGGTGGAGGFGGDVSVLNSGDIVTLGDSSYGVQAQSIGGGGGVGGDASASAVALGAKGAATLSISIGGGGGAGNDAAKVNVTNSGAIQTYGDISYGIFAQSVGGGGGEGGLGTSDSTELNARSGVILTQGKKLANFAAQKLKLAAKTATKEDPSSAKSLAIGISVGGYGGGGGNGAQTVIDNTGSIETWGYGSTAIFAQSIGGGGGDGNAGSENTTKIPLSKGVEVGAGFGGNGGASGNGGEVDVTNSGDIVTNNDVAAGIFAQSIGGGGGTAGFGEGTGSITDVEVAVGGNGGSSGDGGTVNINQDGDIETFGNLSYGIVAQSIGAGGGAAGAGEADYSGKITLGGQGGSAGNGGAVNVNLDGNIITHGNGAFGILAQSIGGGGGLAGDVTGQPVTVLGITVYDRPVAGLLTFPGTGGNGGNGNAVTITSIGTITTFGMRADGIEAQSIGGGGGEAGATTGAAILAGIGTDGGIGSGGTVNINHTGSIAANGENSDAIFAQSAGCHVTSTADCTIPTTVPGGLLMAVAIGDAPGTVLKGGGDISVAVSGGTIQGGSGEGAGIELNDGAQNTITIADDATVTALSGVAIKTTSDDASVTNDVRNSGLVIGDVSMTGGASASFENLLGATFRPNASVNLSGGTLTNSGLLQPGGNGAGADIALNGNLIQTATGTYNVDAGFGIAPTDRIDATGNVTVGGVVAVNFTALMNQPEIIATAGGTLTDAGATTSGNTLIVNFDLDFSGQDLVLVPQANFVTGSLTPNEHAVAVHFQNVWKAGGSQQLAPIMGFLGHLTTFSDYANDLDRMHPEPYLSVFANTSAWSGKFTDALLSCHGSQGELAAIAEEDCSWGQISMGNTRQSRTVDNMAYDVDATQVEFGRQQHLDTNWIVGAAAGYQDWRTVVDNRAGLNGESYIGAIDAKYIDGAWANAVALTGDYTAFDMQRFINLPSPPLTATSKPDLWFAGVRMRSAYLLSAGDFYFKPFIDGALGEYSMSGFQEKGAGPLDLVVKQQSQFVASIDPSAEIGVMAQIGDTTFLRPSLSSGIVLSSNNDWRISSVFAGTPVGVSDFTATTPTHSTMVHAAGTLELLSTDGLSMKLQYGDNFAAHYTDRTWMAKLGIQLQ